THIPVRGLLYTSATSLARPDGWSPRQLTLRFMRDLLASVDCVGSRVRSGAPASGTASCCASVVAQTAVSAVSRVANPLAVRRSNASPISNRRYGRLATCATEQRFMESSVARRSAGDGEDTTGGWARRGAG